MVSCSTGKDNADSILKKALELSKELCRQHDKVPDYDYFICTVSHGSSKHDED